MTDPSPTDVETPTSPSVFVRNSLVTCVATALIIFGLVAILYRNTRVPASALAPNPPSGEHNFDSKSAYADEVSTMPRGRFDVNPLTDGVAKHPRGQRNLPSVLTSSTSSSARAEESSPLRRGKILAKEYRRARHNVFADRETLVTDWVIHDERAVTHLYELLLTPVPAPTTSFLEERVEAIYDRMAAIDALAAIATVRPTDAHARAATDALIAVARGDGRVGDDATSRRAQMGERFDALSAVAGLDLPHAMAIVAETADTGQHSYLTRGVERGLMKAGLSVTAARQAMADAAPEAG